LIDDAGVIVYDNVRGAPDDINFANPQPISRGQIIIKSKTPKTPPAVSSLVLNSTGINEGGGVTLTGTFTDPDAGQTHTVVVDWGDRTAGTTVTVGAGSSNFAVSHVYQDNPKTAPAFSIGVKLTDSTGAVGTGSTSVVVNNVPPVLRAVIGPPLDASTGTAATLMGIFTDVGFLDTHTCKVEWGDGKTSWGTVSETQGSGTCTASHVYSVAGAPTATFTVYDKDGASASLTYKLTVAAR